MKTTMRAVTMCAAAALVIFTSKGSCEPKISFDKSMNVKEIVLGLKEDSSGVIPLPQLPAKTTPRACRPFLLSLAAGGVKETVVIERACTPENEAVWKLMVELRGKTGLSVKISSWDYPAGKAAIEARIRSMVIGGMSQEDADCIVMKTGPMLELAAGAAPAEKEKLLAEAAEALKDRLSRP